MIIDLILDREDAIKIDGLDKYNARDFYYDVIGYGEVGHGITRALDCGSEEEVKRELYRYLVKQGYNLEIKKFIDSVEWLSEY